MKLVISIAGGVLQSIYTDHPSPEMIDINLIDEDNLKAEGFIQEEIDKKHRSAIEGMTAIW